MKKFVSCVMGALMMMSVAAQAASYSSGSSSRSSFSSGSRSSYSAPKSSVGSSSSPKSNYSAPKATTSNPTTLKSLGFAKPASQPTVTRPAVTASANRTPLGKTTTTSGGWFSNKTVSSTPAYKAPIRKVSSPVVVHRTVVVQRNYYGGNSYGGYGYNRGYGYNSYYGPHYGYGGYGSGFGSSFAGALGGLMVYSALTSHHNSGDASASQIEQAKQDQRIEDKLDRVLDGQQQPQGVMPMTVVQAAPVAQPQCYLPEDAPLMMNPSFYCTPTK